MKETKLFWITANRHAMDFPPITDALTEPDGLLAVAGDLSVPRLLEAYRNGIFPWYDDSQPILWWSPNPRTVLLPEKVHISRSLRKHMNKKAFNISFDQAFEKVIHQCAAPRPDENGTWLTTEMIAAYLELHKEGHAHSIECWQEDKLVGGLYGVSIGKVFFGESMFSLVPNASKICLVELSKHLKLWGFKLIDCQVESAHLASMGAEQFSREEFKLYIGDYCEQLPSVQSWNVQ